MNEMTRAGKTGFGRKVLLTGLAVVLGGGTLGGGLGAGWALTNYLLPERAAVEAQKPAFSFANDDADVVPINVKLNSFSGIVKEAAESVVSISVSGVSESFFGQMPSEGAGSGFIFDMDDETVYIATNNHVVENMTEVRISLDDLQSVPAQIVGRDPQSDLAVVSVSKPELDALGVPYRAATLGDSAAVLVGDQVVAIGNSLGEGQIATYGIISAVGKQIDIEGKQLDVMQTDAAINMGNSGGPLVSAQGQVIGINTAKTIETGVEGMSFSIPINEAAEILGSLRVDGVVKKPYLGILRPQTVNDAIMRQYNLPANGVLVSGVDENSGAAQAGLQPWDLIAGFNGTAVKSTEELADALSGAKAGDTVTLKVFRNGEEMELTVVLGETAE